MDKIENEVINQAITYIMTHISEEIQVEDVAEYCHFSKYHFNRMFKDEMGESIYSFIKRVRMEQSAFRLKVERQKSVTEICNDYGYSSSNYSSAFKQHHQMSPADFRKYILEQSLSVNPNWEEYSELIPTSMIPLEECEKNITVEMLEDFFVIYDRFKGNYHNMSEKWCEFMDQYQDYMTKDTILLESTYDDPSITNVDGCMYDLCMTVPTDCALENTRVMEGGRFVIYHFKGHLWDLYPVHQSLLGIWFPQSGYAIDNRYGFDIYRYIDEETMYMEIDICIPIE